MLRPLFQSVVPFCLESPNLQMVFFLVSFGLRCPLAQWKPQPFGLRSSRDASSDAAGSDLHRWCPKIHGKSSETLVISSWWETPMPNILLFRFFHLAVSEIRVGLCPRNGARLRKGQRGWSNGFQPGRLDATLVSRCGRHVQYYIGTNPHDGQGAGGQGPLQTQGAGKGGFWPEKISSKCSKVGVWWFLFMVVSQKSWRSDRDHDMFRSQRVIQTRCGCRLGLQRPFYWVCFHRLNDNPLQRMSQPCSWGGNDVRHISSLWVWQGWMGSWPVEDGYSGYGESHGKSTDFVVTKRIKR